MFKILLCILFVTVIAGCDVQIEDRGEPKSEFQDTDGDGVYDHLDIFPFDPKESLDNDLDGIGNNADQDDDNDGVKDVNDAFPLVSGETHDTDQDGIGNNSDLDDDGDGVFDVNDDFPLDGSESMDTDGDGIGNNADLDDDGDGVLDLEDQFPLDLTESIDTDGDGLGDNKDPDADADADGIINLMDDFPFDKRENKDTDNDGLGNNADDDDDGDGVKDYEDAFPLDYSETSDTDGDGIGDNKDDDLDGDGVENAKDAFPLDLNESLDTDMDGIGNNADQDDDGDGVIDTKDVFPLDRSESTDTDSDGIGNNSDLDDDNDGVPDESDVFPLDVTQSEWPFDTSSIEVEEVNKELIDSVEIAQCLGRVERKTVNYQTNIEKIITDGQEVYPSQIISINGLKKGVVEQFYAKRLPLKFSVEHGGISLGIKEVEEPTQSSIGNAHREILEELIDNNRLALPTQTLIKNVESVEHKQTVMDIGASISYMEGSLGASWGDNSSSSTYSSVFLFNQKFYTYRMEVDNYGLLSSIIDRSEVNNLTAQIDSDEDDRPAIITAVDIGRVIIVKVNYEKKQDTTSESINAAWGSFFGGNANESESKIVEESSFEAVVIGGSSSVLQYITDTNSLLNELASITELDPSKNIGVPISYKVSFLSDGLPKLKVGLTTEFTLEEEFINKGDYFWQVSEIANDFSHSHVQVSPCESSGWGCNWKNEAIGGNEDGISLSVKQDHAYKLVTNIYNRFRTSATFKVEGVVPQVYMNGNEYLVSNDLVTVEFPAGWSVLEVYDGSQTGDRELIVGSLEGLVDNVDSYGCLE